MLVSRLENKVLKELRDVVCILILNQLTRLLTGKYGTLRIYMECLRKTPVVPITCQNQEVKELT